MNNSSSLYGEDVSRFFGMPFFYHAIDARAILVAVDLQLWYDQDIPLRTIAHTIATANPSVIHPHYDHWKVADMGPGDTVYVPHGHFVALFVPSTVNRHQGLVLPAVTPEMEMETPFDRALCEINMTMYQEKADNCKDNRKEQEKNSRDSEFHRYTTAANFFREFIVEDNSDFEKRARTQSPERPPPIMDRAPAIGQSVALGGGPSLPVEEAKAREEAAAEVVNPSGEDAEVVNPSVASQLLDNSANNPQSQLYMATALAGEVAAAGTIAVPNTA